jgi:hypothetical protein
MDEKLSFNDKQPQQRGFFQYRDVDKWTFLLYIKGSPIR